MISEDAASAMQNTIRVDRLRGQIPGFCEILTKHDEPLLVIGVDFWPERLNDDLGDGRDPEDEVIDYDLGDCYGRDAVWFIRNRHGATLLALILNSMGKRLHEEQRRPGALERGFLDRIKADCSDVVDAMVMECGRQHPDLMN